MTKLLQIVALALAASALTAQDIRREVVANLVRTAYLTQHGTLEEFDASLVSVTPLEEGADVGRWDLELIGRRLWVVRAKPATHLMPSLLRMPSLSRSILRAHYGGW